LAVKLQEIAPEWQSPSQDLAEALGALGNRYRLDILRLLDSGDLGVREIAGALGISPIQSRRCLKELVAAGLVESYPTEDGQRFGLNRPAIALLNASFVSLLGRAGSAAPGGAPYFDSADVLPVAVLSPPDRCLNCQNVGFVRGVLEELDHLVVEARDYQSRLQLLSSQVLAAHEVERKRIARDLHDDTAQALTSILVRLRLLERAVNGEVRDSVIELHELTGSALDSVRRIASDLRPTALDDLGLIAALHSYIEKFSHHWPIRIEFSTNGLRRRLPAEVELVLYRVIQEALSNVAKHSGARSVKVSLSRKKNVVTASVRDDGKGFDVEEVTASGQASLGLFGMRERLALVSGWLQIESRVGEGTLVTARVPLSRWGQRHD